MRTAAVWGETLASEGRPGRDSPRTAQGVAGLASPFSNVLPASPHRDRVPPALGTAAPAPGCPAEGSAAGGAVCLAPQDRGRALTLLWAGRLLRVLPSQQNEGRCQGLRKKPGQDSPVPSHQQLSPKVSPDTARTSQTQRPAGLTPTDLSPCHTLPLACLAE